MLLLTRRPLAFSNPFCIPGSLLNTALHFSAKSSKFGKQLLSPPSRFSRVSKKLPQKAPWDRKWICDNRSGIKLGIENNLPTSPWLKILRLPPATRFRLLHLRLFMFQDWQMWQCDWLNKNTLRYFPTRRQ